MPGDYSRKIFDPRKRYSGVLMQQGRVQLDSDWNEQLDIARYRTHKQTEDVIGLCGVPAGSDGFQIGAVAGGRDLTISAGRIYAGGLMCELDEPGTTYTTQPCYPNPDHTIEDASPPASPPGSTSRLNLDPGLYLVYLDAWQREITALDDRRIREVALGGPDTTTRLQTVWQVRLLPLFVSSPPSSPPGEVDCRTSLPEFDALTASATGRMNARAKPEENQNDPCQLPPTAGYQRLENQLYRIQVHTGGTLDTATFKWSRDNATVESTIEKIEGNIITVADIGKDEFLSFRGGQWVEIVTEEFDLDFAPPPLAQIDSIDPNSREITLKSSVAAFAGISNAKLRRWDQAGAGAGTTGIKTDFAQWIDIEGGIQAGFSAGTYKSGDYWLIPARTATGEIEWPPYEIPNLSPVEQLPIGIKHHYCRLALIDVGVGSLDIIDDCRRLFPPLTGLTQLHYVSGDGQEGRPGEELHYPLQVGVANGTRPVADARVRFRVVDGAGSLNAGGQTIVVRTASDGVAACVWRLDQRTSNQRVEATLVDHAALPARFNASFSQSDDQRGIHIREIRLQQRALLNDTNVSFAELSRGIIIDCDEAINPAAILHPTCFVTLEMPFPFNGIDRELWGSAIVGFQPLILSARPAARENSIVWRPDDASARFLLQLENLLRQLQRGERVLAHLRLKGNFIWAANDPDLYLDGEVFGFQRAPSLRGTNIDIRLPSGDGRRGGDFEMWFWLTSATAPRITVTPATLDFRAIPASVDTLTLTVSNTGEAPLSVTAIQSSNTSFQVIAPTGAFVVPAGGQQPVTVRYRTTSTTEQTGTLTIESNALDQPRTNVSMVGPGIQISAPNITLTPASVDFGNVSFTSNQISTRTLAVRNTGNAALRVTGIRSSNPVFAVTSPTGEFSVAAGAQQIVTLVFRPRQIGVQTGNLEFASNDPNQPIVNAGLRGTGIIG